MTSAERCPGSHPNPQPEPIPAGVSRSKRAEIFDAHAEGLRRRYDSLYPVIDRAGRKLAAAFEELKPAVIADPEGEGAEALEKAEAYFHAQREDLNRLRNNLSHADAPPDHNVFDALDRLDGLYAVGGSLPPCRRFGGRS